MSTFEELWFDPGSNDVAAAAARLASSLAMRMRDGDDGCFVWGDHTDGFDTPVGGEVYLNDYAEFERKVDPEDFAIFDGVPMIWQLRSTEREHQEAVALEVFRRMVERLAWPAILTHDFDTLVATYDRERGLREFPPGTLSDGRHRHIWA